MKIKATPFGMLSLVLLALPVANAAVVRINFGTGDGTTPGGAFVSAGNLLATNLSSASFLSGGTFYFNPADLTRLYDNALGTPGGYSAFTVTPNIATLQFNLTGAFNLTEIRTYASWDSGRDGQQYVVKYATAAAPSSFTTLHSVSAYDNAIAIFPTESREVEDDSGNGTGVYEEVPITDTSSTLVTLTEDSTGVLAENVVSLQFVFDVYYQDGRGYENGGTAFREFQVLGTSVSSVPEPGTFLPAALLVAGAWLRRRRPRNHRSSGAAA
jgi:MYXO-CTERM domain-containing protein